jgi:prepilin-type processing-associated H-X9-DG protein/prepilin-type N-terminal cleavage/methylation domain-containing protein
MRLERTRRQFGFSITELMVVIAIVAVLAALLLPAIARSKARARKTNCTSNLKQWGVMWNLFTSDNDGNFSTGRSSGFPRGEWVWALSSMYMEKPSLLLCPEATMRRQRCSHLLERKVRPDLPESQLASYGGSHTAYHYPANPEIDPTPGKFWISSYGMNSWAYDVERTLQGREPQFHWRHMDIEWETSEVPLFADAMWRGGGPDTILPDKFESPSVINEWTGVKSESKHFAIKRHGNGINMLFFDGSVRATKRPLEVWGFKWHNQYDQEAWRTNQYADWIR